MVLGTTPAAGSLAYAIYGWETTFNSTSASINKSWGHDVKLSALTFERDFDELVGLGNVETSQLLAKNFKGSFSLDWVMGNGFFWRALTGNTSVDGGIGPYTHSYLNTGATPATLAKQAGSFSLDNGVNLDNDYHGIYTGCKMNSLTLTANQNEAVRCKADVLFANIATKDSSLVSNIDDTWSDPFVFSMGALKLPTGTTISEVLSVELTFQRNPQYLVGLGNFKPTQAPNTVSKYTCKANIAFEDPAKVMDLMLGSSSALTNQPAATTLDLNFDNGLGTTSSRKLELSFTGVKIPSYALPQSAEEVIKEDVSLIPKNWTLCRTTDNTSVSL